MKGLVAALLAGCTPLLDLEGPCGQRGRCDGSVIEIDMALPPTLDAGEIPDPDARPSAPPDQGVDARSIFDLTPPDAAPPDAPLDACAEACAHVGICLARPNICPALRSVDRDELVAACGRLCEDGLAPGVLEQPCESIVDLVAGVADVLPEDCLRDTAPLPAMVEALSRFNTLTPVSGMDCPALPGAARGESFARLATFGMWEFESVLGPALAGLPGPALVLVFEGWPAGKTGNQVGEVALVTHTAISAAARGEAMLQDEVSRLQGWVNAAELTSAPGTFDLPVPVLPGEPLRMPLERVELRGDLVVGDAGVRVRPAWLTGYLTRAGMVTYAERMQQRCAFPDPLVAETCMRLEMSLGLLRNPAEEVADQLWQLVPPDTLLPDDAGSPVACQGDCNAASVCMAANLGPGPMGAQGGN